MSLFTRLFLLLFSVLGLSACTSIQFAKGTSANACQLTEPHWVKPPEDSAIQDPPTHSHYFVNEDSSILASASWTTEEDARNIAKEWIKVGWFRPAGADLVITGQRLDGEAPPMESEVSCCYPTRFQASGLYFPTAGCWEVTARAAESELSFTVWIEP